MARVREQHGDLVIRLHIMRHIVFQKGSPIILEPVMTCGDYSSHGVPGYSHSGH